MRADCGISFLSEAPPRVKFKTQLVNGADATAPLIQSVGRPRYLEINHRESSCR
jgi:hypothetical protein